MQAVLKYGETELDKFLFEEMRKNGINPDNTTAYTVTRKVGELTIITVTMMAQEENPNG